MHDIDRSLPGSQPIFLSSHNQRGIYDLVRTNGALSRADVMRRNNLTFPSVSRLVDDLIQRGLLREGLKRRGGMGKPPTELEVDEARPLSVGMAYSDACLRAVLVDPLGNVLARAHENLAGGDAETLLASCGSVAERLKVEEKIAARSFAGVGIALPASFAGATLGRSAFVSTTEPGSTLGSSLSRQLGCPVWVERSATAGAVGERWLGAGRDLGSYYYLALSDDVSGALLVHGRPRLGTRGHAGALGAAASIMAAHGSELSTAGSRLFEELRGAGHDTQTDTLERLLSGRDEQLLGWLDETAGQLAPVLVAAESLLDPQAFVLGGTLPAPLTGALLERLVSLSRERRSPQRHDAPTFLQGASGEDTLAVAAATLPLYWALSPDAPTGRVTIS